MITTRYSTSPDSLDSCSRAPLRVKTGAGYSRLERLLPAGATQKWKPLRSMKSCASWFATAIVTRAMLVDLPPRGWASAVASIEQTKAMTPSDGGSTVSKTVFSDKIRLLFVVGLEGAGHHYVDGATHAVLRNHRPSPLNGTMFQDPKAFYVPAIMKKSAAAFHMTFDAARDDMLSLAQQAERLPYPGSFRVLKGRSFPTGFGVHRVLQYMDLRLIAEAAEAGGVDLRVLYLKRSARELLLADTVHRHFQK